MVNTALKEAGADYTKVKYVEVPFPDMNAALEAGRVDAAFQVEPGYSGGLAAGSKNLANAYEAMAPNYTVATYFASKQYIAEHRDVVDRFTRAMQKSLEYAAGHDEEVRAIVGTYTEIPPEVLDEDEPAGVEGRPQRADDRADIGRRQGVRLHRGGAGARRPDPARLSR